MPNDDLKLLFDSIRKEIINNPSTVFGSNDEELMFSQLVNDTLAFRDKLKDETGYVLTVEDTQAALLALENHINGKKPPTNLTSRQKALADILIDRYILMKHNL